MKFSYKNITWGILLACSMASCDLDTTPTNYLPSEDAFKTTARCESVLNGTWSSLFTNGSTYASIGLGSIMMNDDFAGSDVVRTTSYGYSSSYSLTNGYGRGEINDMAWDLFYDAINNCNNIIAYIDQAEGSEEDKNIIKGQALATRGYVYMLLATHYSFGVGNEKYANNACVPIYTEPTDLNMALTGKPASTVKDVFQRSLTDLGDAYSLIPDNYNRGINATDQYRIDKTVVKGLLARTNLYAGEWQAAYNYADEAMTAKGKYLMSEEEFKSGFNDATNEEWMWGFSSTLEDNLAAYNFNFKDCTTEGSYYSCFNVDPFFKEKFEDNDYRKDLFRWGANAGYGEWTMLNYKFKFADINNGLGDIILMRVAEMFLIKAEAATHLPGKEGEAQSLLKELRQARLKAGNTAAEVTATGDELREEIWLERRKELWGEGFSLTDLIRNQKSLERKNWSHYVECILKPDGSNSNIPILDENGELTYADDKPESYKKERCTLLQGHIASRTVFPDGSEFEPNSKYYLFRIPEQEELQNANLYTEHPMLPLYN